MLVGFQNDTTLYPLETAFFQERDEDGSLIEFNKTAIYVNDTIGLQTLDKSKKVERKLLLNKGHLHFDSRCEKYIFVPFLYSVAPVYGNQTNESGYSETVVCSTHFVSFIG